MELPSTKDFQWKSLAPLPSRRVYSTLVEAAGQVFAVGGCDDNGVPVDSFEVYSPEADQWAALPPMPTARAGVAVTALGKRIMVIGGVGTNQLPLKVVEMYNTDEGRWRKRSSLREAAMGISVTAKGKEGPAGAARGVVGIGDFGIWSMSWRFGFGSLSPEVFPNLCAQAQKLSGRRPGVASVVSKMSPALPGVGPGAFVTSHPPEMLHRRLEAQTEPPPPLSPALVALLLPGGVLDSSKLQGLRSNFPVGLQRILLLEWIYFVVGMDFRRGRGFLLLSYSSSVGIFFSGGDFWISAASP